MDSMVTTLAKYQRQPEATRVSLRLWHPPLRPG
jgi:hypothetical protein